MSSLHRLYMAPTFSFLFSCSSSIATAPSPGCKQGQESQGVWRDRHSFSLFPSLQEALSRDNLAFHSLASACIRHSQPDVSTHHLSSGPSNVPSFLPNLKPSLWGAHLILFYRLLFFSFIALSPLCVICICYLCYMYVSKHANKSSAH